MAKEILRKNSKVGDTKLSNFKLYCKLIGIKTKKQTQASLTKMPKIHNEILSSLQ
jgi:hypothetical protein